MNSISVVVITFNEEANIGRCLDSVMGIADEIIVVDSDSTDQTRAIAESKNGIVYKRAWAGYSAAKNYGNEQATKEWIFSIDADEALSPELQRSIREFKSSAPVAGAFEVNRLTNYCGHWVRYCGWYPEWKMRMWKRGAGDWQGELHEKIIFHSPVPVARLQGHLLHYSFPSIRHHIHTLNAYSEIASAELVSKNKKVNFIIHLLLNPLFTFFNKYFFKLGFLDGYYGFVICWLSAQANFLKYSKAFIRKRSAH
jgi:glycosyltransferase involved in cell wall biosynthesis